MEPGDRSKRSVAEALLAVAAAILPAGCSTDALLDGEPDLVTVTSGGESTDMACATHAYCGGQCVDLLTDGKNCGGCGVACGSGAVCSAGKCIQPDCAADKDCDDSIRCTVDRCMNGFCHHAAGPNEGATACPPGQVCDAMKLNFQDLSHDLEKNLGAEGNFFMECIHNCKHGEPPFDPPMGFSKYSALWQFAFDHPYWLPAGDSPYRRAAVPANYPPWCGIGRDSAIRRTGDCPPPGC